MTETTRAYHEQRLVQLKTLRTPWEEAWREIDEYLVPGYVRLNPTSLHADRGNRRRLKVIDNKGQQAHGIFRSGMMSGMTSKARPWNKLTTHDMAMREVEGVKTFLDVSTMRMREVMNKSNIYDVFHTKYGALGAVGTAVSYMSPDPRFVVRNNSVICGYYWIATNALGMVDTLYHEISMTAAQIVEKFNAPSDKVPKAVKEAYDKGAGKSGTKGGNRDQSFTVYHAMEPRNVRDLGDARSKHKPWMSNYWMRESSGDEMLREAGSDINRVIGSRWDVVDNDPYGYSPGMDAMCDIRQLQSEQRRKLEIIDKTSNPPMSAPTSMKGKRHSLLPGSITYNDEVNRNGGYRPAVDLSSYNLSYLLGDIQDLHSRIDTAFKVDIFMAITNMQGVQPRNEFEIAERKDERLLQLGPALDRLQAEELQPTIGIIYHYMKEANLLPPLPPELEENEGELTVEYTSIMAQAQKAVGTGSIERFSQFVGGFVEVKPEAMDKLDVDQAIDEFGDRIGVPSSVIVSDAKVKEVRAARAQEMAQEKQMQQAERMAPVAQQGAAAAASMADIGNVEGDPLRMLTELGVDGGSGF